MKKRLLPFLALLFITVNIQAQNPILWGINELGGKYGGGNIFKTDSSGTVTDVYDFKKDTAGDSGYFPSGSLVFAPNGFLYGNEMGESEVQPGGWRVKSRTD